MIPAQGNEIHFMYIHFTSAIFDFVLRIEPTFDDSNAVLKPLGAVGATLASHAIVRSLTTLLCVLGGSTSSMAASALVKCFKILGSILMAYPGNIQWLLEALESRLLRALVICSGGANAARVHKFLEFFIVIVIPPRLVYPGVLAALDVGLNDVGGLVTTDTFKRSPIYARWNQFSGLAEDRIKVLKWYEEGRTPSVRACDNLQCGQIRVKPAFRRCSGCLSLYYCSTACQSLDWLEGGHRKACKAYGTLTLRGDNDLDLSTRDRSFLRALIHHDYQKRLSKVDLFSQTATCLATQPGEDFLVLYDYTRGEVKINIQLLSNTETERHLGCPEWMDIISRAKRSGWRMGLDVMVFDGPHGIQYHAIPLRTNKSSVHDGLQALADALPADRQTWDDVKVATLLAPKIGDLIFALAQDADFLEVH
ncbi:hypothetical protein DFH06DRAFT_1203372 [Mycena polygramma]|nr:hypothetical protein DFH06DRAFT_1203372 [Mycena polygramma]